MPKLSSKKAIREEWVRRLRSGKIQQCQRFLGATDGRRCCLGVLCDIAVENGVIPTPNSFYSKLVYNGVFSYLPEVVRVWAGLAHNNGYFRDSNLCSLSGLNDTGANFSKIADVIESAPDGLFVKETSA